MIRLLGHLDRKASEIAGAALTLQSCRNLCIEECVCVCVCVCERDVERQRKREQLIIPFE